MNIGHITYDLDDERLQLVQRLIERATMVMPPWLQGLHVRAEDEDADCFMATSCNYPYRMATFYVGRALRELPPLRREMIVLHEAMHITLHPLDAFGRRCVRKHGGRDRELHAAVEGAATDLATVLHPLLFPMNHT